MAEVRKIDAVTTEIIRNGMVAATEEMKSNLMRTAYNMIIYEALDFTVGIFDRAGNTVSIGIGLPMFIRGMSNTVKRMIAHFGYDQIEDGDVLLTNDAYITGSHLNHMTFVVPVFFGQGGHLRNDFPVLLESCQKQFPGVKLSATPAVGEDLAVLQAIVDFGARAL